MPPKMAPQSLSRAAKPVCSQQREVAEGERPEPVPGEPATHPPLASRRPKGRLPNNSQQYRLTPELSRPAKRVRLE